MNEFSVADIRALKDALTGSNVAPRNPTLVIFGCAICGWDNTITPPCEHIIKMLDDSEEVTDVLKRG